MEPKSFIQDSNHSGLAWPYSESQPEYQGRNAERLTALHAGCCPSLEGKGLRSRRGENLHRLEIRVA